MWKYYILLMLIVGGVLFYIFQQDPCNDLFRAEFSDKYPDYEILDTGAGEGSPDSVQCHVLYEKPGSKQIYEDVWLYQNSADGWGFSRILTTGQGESAL